MWTHPILAVLWVLADRREEEACVFDLSPLASLSAMTWEDQFLWLSGTSSRLNSGSGLYPLRGWHSCSSGIQTNITKADVLSHS